MTRDRSLRPAKPAPWTEEQRQYVRQMMAAGRRPETLARALGRSEYEMIKEFQPHRIRPDGWIEKA